MAIRHSPYLPASLGSRRARGGSSWRGGTPPWRGTWCGCCHVYGWWVRGAREGGREGTADGGPGRLGRRAGREGWTQRVNRRAHKTQTDTPHHTGTHLLGEGPHRPHKTQTDRHPAPHRHSLGEGPVVAHEVGHHAVEGLVVLLLPRPPVLRPLLLAPGRAPLHHGHDVLLH